MAKRRTRTPAAVPDALRDAVERTVQATQLTRDRAQDAVDELVKGTEERAGRVRRGAETGAESVRDRVKGAIDPLRPATVDDLRELRSDLHAIVRRLDAIEERLPAQRGQASRSPAKRASGSAKGRSAAGSKSRSATGSKSRSSSRARAGTAAKRSPARKTSAGRGKAGAKKRS